VTDTQTPAADERAGGDREEARRDTRRAQAQVSTQRCAHPVPSWPDRPAADPAHVTLRLRPGLPSLRSPRLVRVFEQSLIRAAVRPDFRLVHYSLQSNHAHLVVEAADPTALGRGMKALGTRLALAVHRAFGRHGPVLAERYHLRVLRTPREVRNVLRYVLLNARRHASRVVGSRLDPASSARWFDGWARAAPIPPGPWPVARARTWLLRIGWRRHGPISPDDVPGPGHGGRSRRRPSPTS
jgi:REP-associated tyrosine transposase